MTVNRQEHLQWCKQRALEYANAGDVHNALAFLLSDLGKHPETEGHAAIQLGMLLTMGGQLNTARQMVEFINGCN